MTISIRPLEDADLVQADALLKLAFRSSISRLDDLQFYRQIQPDGWFVASRQEYLLGMVGATRYGAWAYIGLMAVHPDAQRQGIGFALMNFILAELERRQVETVWLDASEMGRPLYEKLGFLSCDETLIFQRSTSNITGLEPAPHVQTLSIRQLDELVQWDTKVFGADRCRTFQVLLNTFPQRSFVQRDATGRLTGYLFAQKNRIGPWAVLQPGSAEELLQIALALSGYEETISVAVPSVNEDAIELMQRYGFEHVRTNRHMWRGVEQYPGQRQKIYAQTSLAIG